jgi:acetoin utilization protein AcuC
MNAGFFYTSRLTSIRFSPDHPFRPDRGQQLLELLNRYNLVNGHRVRVVEPEIATEADLLRFHTPGFVRLLREASASAPPTLEMLDAGLGRPDNPVFEGLYDFVLWSTGATLSAVRAVDSGALDLAFNPVGGFHHGFADHCEGFCYQNDEAIAVLELLEQGRRVAVVDIDAHHGNGVQDAFYADPRVLKISVHQDGQTIYPGTGSTDEIGTGPGEGFTLNLPLPELCDDDLLISAFIRVVPRALEAFAPDLVLLQMGADMHLADPLTGLRMTNRSHQACVRRVAEICPRLVALGGGGYNVGKTVRTWALAWSTLTGIEPVDDFAGMVGSAMYGADSGTLLDPPYTLDGEEKQRNLEAVEAMVARLQAGALPALEAALAAGVGRDGTGSGH